MIFQFFPKPFWQLSKLEVIKIYSKIFRVLTQHRGQPEEETAEDSEVDSAQEETGSKVDSAPVGQRHIFSFFLEVDSSLLVGQSHIFTRHKQTPFFLLCISSEVSPKYCCNCTVRAMLCSLTSNELIQQVQEPE